MHICDVYTAIVLQPEVRVCASRGDVQDNIDRLVAILSSSEIPRRGVFNVATQVEEWEVPPWAPVKLVALPELTLNLPGAFFGRTRTEDLIQHICIEIPGPETDALAGVCREQGFYLCCGAYEYVPDLPGHVFNTAIVISPLGEIVHRHHKYNPYIPVEICSTSPHDVYDAYLERFGQGETALQTLFPVTETEIGKLGTLICNDGLYPENWRALALNGAEVIIHGNLPEPFASAPHDWRELFARTFAVANMCYVVSPSYGAKLGRGVVKFATGGSNGSFIVDPEGLITSQIPYPGEGITSGVIRLDHLRRRRLDPGTINFLAHLRTEPYGEMYKDPIYPANTLADGPLVGFDDRQRRDIYRLGIVQGLTERGVLSQVAVTNVRSHSPGGLSDPDSLGFAHQGQGKEEELS
jgi:predicted amidohydrolase